MMGVLKKLEALDAVISRTRDGKTSFRKDREEAAAAEERQMFAVPRDGWIGGPGRWFNRA